MSDVAQTDSTTRTRTIAWEDPIQGAQKGKAMSGLDYLKALQAGEIAPPPIAVLMGMWIS